MASAEPGACRALGVSQGPDGGGGADRLEREGPGDEECRPLGERTRLSGVGTGLLQSGRGGRGQTNSTVRKGTSKIAGETKQTASLSRPGPVGLSQSLPFLLYAGPSVCMLDHKPARTWKIRNQDCPCGLNVKINQLEIRAKTCEVTL